MGRPLKRKVKLVGIAAEKQALSGTAQRLVELDGDAEKKAWESLKLLLGTNGWDAGDHGNNYAFFLHGWDACKNKPNETGAAAPPSAAATK